MKCKECDSNCIEGKCNGVDGECGECENNHYVRPNYPWECTACHSNCTDGQCNGITF